MPAPDLRLFALSETHDFGARVAAAMNRSLDDHEEQTFTDGEHLLRSLVNVRGRDVFVVQSLHGGPRYSISEKLTRLLLFIGALEDADARRITVLIPYLCYARKDRKTRPRDPVSTRYIAAMLEAVGADRVVTMDVHNLAAFQNAFRVGTDHLEARPLFVQHAAHTLSDEERLVVLSPDEGGVKRAARFAEGLRAALGRDIQTAFVEKIRREEGVSGGTLVGDVAGATVLVLDDLISTGGTIAQAAQSAAEAGAARVILVITHGLFVGAAAATLQAAPIAALWTTNTIPPFRLQDTAARDLLTVCDAAPLFADAIRAIHTGGSVTKLLRVRG
ncbi:ribose-phosphate diphosphokinase [Salisaeta longa]|uniref:ribose-phosphate diphosphokinase n=1 Tax=Salisaeta longa TaxID=503170 RepID=UPI0003B78879|nr:ribose-phosphate diphosphokinase [Salisaeta longa]